MQKAVEVFLDHSEEIILRYNEQHLTQLTISPFAYGPLQDLLKEDGSVGQSVIPSYEMSTQLDYTCKYTF